MITLIILTLTILVASVIFCYSLEDLGNSLKLSPGFTASVLIAVGTATPELLVPIVAIVSHHHDIGTGAVHICGCMKGGDEYAMQRVQSINKPRQIVLYYHPKYGEIGKEIVYLNRYDSRKGQFNDILPDVWSKTFS